MARATLLSPSFLLMALSGHRTDDDECPLLAQSGHPDAVNQCPLLGVKRTLDFLDRMSALDPKRTWQWPACERDPPPQAPSRKNAGSGSVKLRGRSTSR